MKIENDDDDDERLFLKLNQLTCKTVQKLPGYLQQLRQMNAF